MEHGADPPDPSLRQLKAETLAAMAAAWHGGQRPPAETWLKRHPLLASDPQLAVRIIYEEVCLREELGETVDSGEIFARFPQWQNELAPLLDCHGLLQAHSEVTTYPTAGQPLGEFQLLAELGRGAVGRVFLATQPALSDRPLVVKLTPRSGDEHLSLARLQHTHIVPLYLVQDFPAEHLRALCMPFLGGDSWAHVLEDLKDRRPPHRTGRHIVELLEAAQSESVTLPTPAGPALRFLNRASYVQAICWIGSCLADGLHYAHQRGLVHLDIKPSNVLLAGDGQPMLLDFHLARDLIPAGAEAPDRLGGTKGYMSPEQQLATTAVREGRPLAIGLDQRSDIYSLGALLFESLVGHLPSADEATSRGTLRMGNPQVGRGLEDVVHKCLARDPDARYADAGELATDLRRHLADLPLVGVPNRSLAERWQKWRRRKPHSLGLVAMALVALAVTGTVGLLYRADRLREARTALSQGQQQIATHDYSPAIERLASGLQAIRWFPGEYDLKQLLQEQLNLARQARLGETLHQLVERLRFVESSNVVAPAKLSELAAGCRTVWEAREQIVQHGTSGGDAAIEENLRIDLLDLAVMWADLQIRLAPRGQDEPARHHALTLLNEAEQLCGSSPVVELARRDVAATLPEGAADPRPASSPETLSPPKTVWEHYAIGRSLFRADKLEQAAEEFRQAIDLEPNAFWPNFYLAICAYRLEDFATALNAASVCVALSPQSAECFFNRALAQQALGQSERALADFARAMELDPQLPVAALNRGMLLASLNRYAEAEDDLGTALKCGADPAETYYQLALVQLAQQDRTAAMKSVTRALEHDRAYGPALGLRSRLGK